MSGDSCSSGSCSTGACGDKDRLPPGMLSTYNLNVSTADGTLVWLEVLDGNLLSEASLELVSKAKAIDDSRVFGVMFGGLEVKGHYRSAFSHGVDTIYHVKNDGFSIFDCDSFARCISEVTIRTNPALIMIGATARGTSIASRIACTLDANLLDDCIDIEIDGQAMSVTRYGQGGAMEESIPFGTSLQIITARPGTFKRAGNVRDGIGTAIYWKYHGRDCS